MTSAVSAPERLYHSPRGLYAFQADGVAHAYMAPAKLAVWDMGTGKMAPISEPVLTPDGWRTMGDLRSGDYVIGRDGHPTEVLSVHPQTSRQVYRLACSDGSWSRCGPDHLWTVQYRTRTSRKDGPRRYVWREKTLSTAQLLAEGLHNSARDRRWRIPIASPVQYPARNLPIDPYALGVVLGDAWVSPVGQVHLTTDKEILDAIGARGKRYHHESDGVELLVSSQWSPQLREMQLAGCRSQEKFVPEEYLRAPEADRRALLAGLLDTDGHPMHTGGIEFSSTSLQLARAVIELTESLGGSARMGASRRTTYTHNGEQRVGRESWRVNVKLGEQPFRLARKMIRWVQPTKYPVARMIASIEPAADEDCICIRVAAADGLYLTRHHLVTHNTHLAMATSCMLYEDKLIDQILVVCEGNKLGDWALKDFVQYTHLSSGLYLGPKRAKVLEDPPQVIVTTYETSARDFCQLKPHTRKVLGSGPLMDFLADKNVLVIYDELTKLAGRGSQRYKAHDYALKRLRKAGQLKVLGLTGTPIERSPANGFNIARLLDPERMPTVAQFDKDYVADWDRFGNPCVWKNLSPSNRTNLGVTPLSELIGHLVMRKRKSDPDIRDQFPKMMEEAPTYVTLHPKHQSLLEAVADEIELSIQDPERLQIGIGILRQLAGHPAAVLRSQGQMAQKIVREVGEAGLRAIPSAKTEELLDWCLRMGSGQGVVFSWFGQSILPELYDAMTRHGFSTSFNTGGMSVPETAAAKESFERGDNQFFLSSDAGCRGLNLGMGEALLHYEPSGIWAVHKQRSDRISRIDSLHTSVTVKTLVALDTPDEFAFQHQLDRQEMHEIVFDYGVDPAIDVVTSDMRRRLAAMAKKRR